MSCCACADKEPHSAISLSNLQQFTHIFFVLDPAYTVLNKGWLVVLECLTKSFL